MNKYRHHAYNPSFDHVFGRLLYEGLPEEAERLEDKNGPKVTISDFIAQKQTYVKAIAMAKSETAEKFRNPPKTFEKKVKAPPKLDMEDPNSKIVSET